MTDRTGDVATVLEELGVEIHRVARDEINGRCPVHYLVKGRESSRFSWYMNSETGLWVCHSCGARGNLPILVGQLTDDDDAIIAVQRTLIRSGLERLSNPQHDEEEHVEVDWMQYAQFEQLPSSVMEYRGLDADTSRRFGIRWDTEHKAVIIPIVSQLGELWGWQMKKSGMFKNVPTGVHKGQTLFGIERSTQKSCMLLESPLDVVRYHSVLPDSNVSALASFGANVSYEQVVLIARRFDHLIVALDNDKAGRLESRRLKDMWPPLKKGVRYLDYKDMDVKDVGEMSNREIRALSFTARCP